MLIRRGEDFAMLRGQYLRRDMPEEISAAIQPGRRKTFRRDGKPYQRIADHIGAFPLVLLSPADIYLVSGEPADRRRFIDQIISQRDARYLDTLLRYNAALEQRNKLLKAESADVALFEVLEQQLEFAAEYITARRHENIAGLQKIFAPFYTAIADNGEVAELAYKTADYSAAGGLAEHMAANRRRDLALGYTASGPHRDDIDFSIDALPVRRSASQGRPKPSPPHCASLSTSFCARHSE